MISIIDALGRLVKVTDGTSTFAEFSYDALGRRVRKYDGAIEETRYYYYNADWQVLFQ